MDGRTVVDSVAGVNVGVTTVSVVGKENVEIAHACIASSGAARDGQKVVAVVCGSIGRETSAQLCAPLAGNVSCRSPGVCSSGRLSKNPA